MAAPEIVICPACGGSTWLAGDIPCPVCEQRGRVTVAAAAEWQSAQEGGAWSQPGGGARGSPWPLSGPRRAEGQGAGGDRDPDRMLAIARRDALLQQAAALLLMRSAVLAEAIAIERAYGLKSGGKNAKS